MKNKKLFAILTLVCFMMTLMPVAAFAVDGELDDTYIKNTGSLDTTNLNIANSTTDTVYVFAVKDGVIYRGLNVGGVDAPANGIVEITDANVKTTGGKTVTLSFDNGGTYTVYVAERTGAGLEAIVKGDVYKTPAELTEIMLGAVDATAAMTKNIVTVKVDADTVYTMAFADVSTGTPSPLSPDPDEATAKLLALNANNGFTGGVINVKLQENSQDLRGAKLTYDTVGYVTVTPIDTVTDKNGCAKFKVSASKAGNYKVFVSYNGHTEVINVKVSTNGAVAIETLKQPAAPVALDTTINKSGDVTATVGYHGVVFKITDANGDAYTVAEDIKDTPSSYDEYSVTVIERPVDSVLGTTVAPLTLKHVPAKGGYVLAGHNGQDLAFDAEGKYVIRIALENGAAATATVNVKEFGTPVAIKFIDAPATITYASTADVVNSGIVLVDANGVTAPANPGDVTYSVNGKAANTFSSPYLTASWNEDYIGSTIDLIAVWDKNGKTLTVVNTMTVVDAAQSIVYEKTNVEAAVNNTLYANIVDANGKNVLNLTSTAVQAIVLDKPENAIVVANADTTLVGDQVKLSFIASAAGEYKVQTIVTYNSGANYISDIVTITVGGAQSTFKDVIVLSIGSNNMIKNGEVGALLAAPEIKDGRTMIPMRAGLEAFGATVNWNEADRTVTAEMNGVKVVMTVDSLDYTVNGKAMKADSAPYIKNGSTMVPAVFFTNAFGIVATPLYDANGVCDVLFSK